MRLLRLVHVLCLTLLIVGACYHATIETGTAPGPQMIRRSWAPSYLDGLISPPILGTAAVCPTGVSRVETRHSVPNILVGLVTLGMYTPIRIDVTCSRGTLSVPFAQMGRILGVFDQDTGQPIDGAKVTDRGTGTWAVTTATGTVSLGFITDNSSVAVSKAGYAPISFELEPSDTASVTVVLTRTPTMPAANAARGLTGFAVRCQDRRASCFTERDFEKRLASRISDFLAKVPGVRRVCQTGMSECRLAMKSTIDLEDCSPAYFLNGDLFMNGLPESALTDLEQHFTPGDLLGIEVYRSGEQIPPEFDRTRGCGAIVIWTR